MLGLINAGTDQLLKKQLLFNQVSILEIGLFFREARIAITPPMMGKT